MTPLERTRTVFSGDIPDRVPVCLPSFRHAARLAGLTVREYCQSGVRMAEAQLAYWDEFRHDIIDIENGIAAMAEAVGCGVAYDDNAAPWVTRPAIESLDDVDRLPTVDPFRSPSLAEFVKATRLVAEKLGETVCIRSESDQGPFSLAAQIAGPEQFMVALFDRAQSERIHRLLAYAVEQIARLARAQIAAGAHYTLIGDSIAGPDVCSPRIYRQFALPYEKRLVEMLRKNGIELGIHICGDATRIIPDMVETGALYLELDHKVDRARARAAVDGRVTILGTLDATRLLPYGTPMEVVAKAREDILYLARRGRYVLAPGCSLPPETPVENVHAILEAAHRFGRYRRSGELQSLEGCGCGDRRDPGDHPGDC